MTDPYLILISSSATRQLKRATSWWRENRPDQRERLLDELEAVFDQLARTPHLGAPYVPRAGVRRWLMPTARYHVYYRVDERQRLVYVRAVWHATRGRGPALSSL